MERYKITYMQDEKEYELIVLKDSVISTLMTVMPKVKLISVTIES